MYVNQFGDEHQNGLHYCAIPSRGKNTRMTYTHVIYVALLEERLPQRASIIELEDLIHDNLFRIGFLPSTLEHLVYGCDIYQISYALNVYCDYQIHFVYPDGIEHFLDYRLALLGNKTIVFLLCANDSKTIVNYCIQLSRFHESNFCYLVNDVQKKAFLLSNTFSHTDDVLSFLYEQAKQQIPIDSKMTPYVVPLFGSDIDRGILFKPSRVNTLTGQRVVGNWGFPYGDYTTEDLSQASKAAHSAPDSTDRQDSLINQIGKLNAIEQMAWERLKPIVGVTNFVLHNQLCAPLILCAPYTNADIRKAYADATKDPAFKHIQDVVNMVLSHEYTLNYVVKPDNPIDSEIIPLLAVASNLLVDRRGQFLDIMAILHGSFRHSPYLRLPLQGVSINRELSFVRPALSEKLLNAADKKAVEYVMSEFGKKLADHTLAPSTREMLQKRPSQIVAITDLPIEWLDNNGIPLGFTHDVCRIPEFPHSGLIQRYCFTSLSHYVIPKDILKHTLVVYGCRDSVFRRFQDMCDDASKILRFTTCECLTKQSFIDALKQHKPQLLIVDTHGNVDTTTRTGYLMMGEERVFPIDIMNSNVHIPLVFLSACNTAPAYESYNTVADGFFNNGALSVTCSYMPLNIFESSVLYLRLLQQLNIAATTKVHANWCEFISHLQRTSYIQSFFIDHTPKKKKDDELTQEETNAMTLEMTASMMFQHRRKVYEHLQSGVVTNKVKTRHNNVIPHYLIYTTLGRADLVRFESFMDDCVERGKKLNMCNPGINST